MDRISYVTSTLLSTILLAGGAGLLAPQARAAMSIHETTGLVEGGTLSDLLLDGEVENTSLEAVLLQPDGEWIVVDRRGDVTSSAGASEDVLDAIDEVTDGGRGRRIPIVAIEMNAAGGWAVVTATSYRAGGALPGGFVSNLRSAQTSLGWRIADVELTDDTYIVISTEGDNVFHSDLITEQPGLVDVIDDTLASGRTLQKVEIGYDGRWLAFASQNPASGGGVSAWQREAAATLAEWQQQISVTELGPGDDFVLYGNGTQRFGSTLADAIEYGVGPTGTDNIWERMEDLLIPGVSIAVLQGGQVAWTRGYGTLEAFGEAPVLASTPFQLASLSKYLGALVLLRLQREGLLDLDDDVMATYAGGITELQTWWDNGSGLGVWDPVVHYNVPDSDGDGSPDPLATGFTIRDLLHQVAGINGGQSTAVAEAGFDEVYVQPMWLYLMGYGCGDDGLCGTGEANTTWTDQSLLPIQSTYAYSSTNFLLAEAAAWQATGLKGDELVQDELIDLLGLQDTFAWPDPWGDDIQVRAAKPHDTGWPAELAMYPWIFAGGVWASAADYGRLLTPLVNGGDADDGTVVIASSAWLELLTPSAANPNYALGVRLGAGNDVWHAGTHPGRARTLMCVNTATQDGIVILTNSDRDVSVGDLRYEILNAFLSASGWPAAEDCGQ